MNKTNKIALKSLLAASAALMLGAAVVPAAYAQASAAGDSGAAMKSDQPVSDTWITTKVKAELATTKGVKSTEIDVKTVDGVVTLTGVLPSKTAVHKAVAVTKSIKGVKQVDDSGLKAKG
ncbi:BON domain-containing protein [Burkholderia glumae]|uniref:BON domain-containing protein n=1 Tax=Burkholderia glumae TaxID=337 RepID=A0AAQ0BV57_BURGL|nr:BON domain-containing protein [Burkholderia glumae]ACR28496.1 Transport-associated protein [Burkholderia glumae BGR1]AJY65315.1 BON domain protein [Burkholderia glumae LMG 2196 = ATCC 33617]KHJ61529.1 transporter [Burkholderia glumae]MCM2480487.1 BON domain-containing protein [Burkholderia glumae]MCM2506884.1 BON domain-containing protein [Burkholderia glumae]